MSHIKDARVTAAVGFANSLRLPWLTYLDTILVAGVISAALLFPLAINRYFYFEDDYQTYYMPMFLEIAHQLKAGFFPLMAGNAWHGGAIAAEYQFAIFNPVSMLLYLGLDSFSDLAWAGAFFALVHYAILAAGMHVLCLELKFSRTGAMIGAVLVCSSTYLLYWGAHSWIATLVSFSWVPWCLASLNRVYRNPKWLPAGSLATALPLLSGWPPTTIGLAAFLCIVIVTGLIVKQSRSQILWVALSAALGAALALPAIMPTAMYVHEATRVISDSDKFLWRADLQGLLTLGLPTMFGPWDGWEGAQHFYFPSFYYLGWFVPIMVANARKSSLGSPPAKIALILAASYALLSVSPSLWPLRWSFRYILFFDFSLALLSAALVTFEISGCHEPWRWSFARTTAAIAVPFAIAMVAVPQAAALQILFVTIAAVFAWGASKSLSNKVWFSAWLLIGQAIFLALIVMGSPTNSAIPDWRPPTRRVVSEEPTREISLFALSGNSQAEDFWQNLSVGNRGLLYGRDTINGYTGITMPGLDRSLCWDFIGASCPEVADKLFERDVGTGLRLIDLLGVSRVVAQRGALADSFRKADSGDEWSLSATTENTETFLRRVQRPESSVAWTSPGTAATLTEVGGSVSKYQVSVGPVSDEGRIIFAKPWYPGYSATLDGRPLRITAYLGIMPEVQVPAGAHGVLVLTYWPAGLTTGLIGAACSCMLLVFLILWNASATRRARLFSSAAV